MEIGKIGGIKGISDAFESEDDSGNILVSFGEYFNDALDKTNKLKLESDNLTDDFAVGKTENIHEVLIAAEKASLAMDFTLQIRNKFLDSYNEIMRMQI